METASIRIKFTPLINNQLKTASKYCLDIVPEVTCIQNLDKITWRQDNDLIEYIIPMTYKVILKRQEKMIENNNPGEHFEKTYHSCIDLLLPSSVTNFDLASGDVSRMTSDTVIFGKISTKICNSVFSDHVIEEKFSGTILLPDYCLVPQKKVKISAKTSNSVINNNYIIEEHFSGPKVTPDLCLIPEKKDKISFKICNAIVNNNVIKENFPGPKVKPDQCLIPEIKDEISPKICNVNNNVIEEHFSDTVFVSNPVLAIKSNGKLSTLHENFKKTAIVNAISKSITTSETNVLKMKSTDKIANTDTTLKQCRVAATQSVEEEIDTKDNSKWKLSLSPICSIDTNSNPFPVNVEVLPLDLKVNHKYELSNIFVSNYYTDVYTNKDFAEYNYKRELPEVRVAKFVKKMEMEILPLKIMLNDLVQKCTALGFSKKQCISKNVILYKSVASPKKKVNQLQEYRKFEKQPKSNRVVYSIVFDG